MTDITHILGGAWQPPQEPRVDPPETQLRSAMLAAGLDPPGDLILDGKLRRFNSGGKRDKSAWYVVFGDGVPAGRFGDWREGLEVTFRADVGRRLSAVEEMAHKARMEEAKRQRDEARRLQAEAAADTVTEIWTGAAPATADHPYLKRKGIQPNGARVTGDGRLVVPLYNPDGELSSLQYISADGEKRYHTGGITKACFWSVGVESETVYLAEGFATAATIHEVTGSQCFVAYSASNLVHAAQFIKSRHNNLVIVADNDKSRVGLNHAEQAAAKYGARVVMPPEIGDANDYHLAGNDLSALLTPKRSDWLVQADEFSQQPAPIAWLVRNWLQRDALIMIHGPSGGGKTFVLLDMLLRIGSDRADWFGQTVKNGPVVYLAGEGHHGLRSRIAAWKHHNGVNNLTVWLSRAGCDLNTPQGYQQVADAIRALPERPIAIAVDTLHRFLAGDENSAQDTKTMLDACAALMAEFGCSVILVHHTGVSDEAQHRARGSSAWRGALDIEISVLPKGEVIAITQRKSKDAELAEPVYVELQSVTIPGWVDEDGEPVSSAVIVQGSAPEEKKNDSKLSGFRKQFEEAWRKHGKEWRGEHPYLSRSALKEYLLGIGIKESTADKKMKPGTPNELIGMLVTANLIESHEHGWRVLCANTINSLKILDF